MDDSPAILRACRSSWVRTFLVSAMLLQALGLVWIAARVYLTYAAMTVWTAAVIAILVSARTSKPFSIRRQEDRLFIFFVLLLLLGLAGPIYVLGHPF